jgi:hypothetical protein
VRYEDFVSRPRPTVAALLKALRLDGSVDSIGGNTNDRIDLSSSHGLAGNPSRFQVGCITVRPDEKWKKDMSTRDRRTVTALTWPHLLGYGYLSAGGRGQS